MAVDFFLSIFNHFQLQFNDSTILYIYKNNTNFTFATFTMSIILYTDAHNL